MSQRENRPDRKPAGANPLIKLIKAHRISTLAQLRSAFRILLMKSHPDAVGSDRLLDKHLLFSSYYEEAKTALLEQDEPRSKGPTLVPVDHRLAYYKALQRLERLDKPYGFHRSSNLPVINELKSQARFHFGQWNTRDRQLYSEADRDHDRLKTEKPSGPYMKNALAMNVSPVFHNIVAYHLTGVSFYRNQVKQNLDAVLQKLAEHDCLALRSFIELLIDDMKNGPAVFGGGKGIVDRKLPARTRVTESPTAESK